MPAVFISYSRSDKRFVERLHDALKSRTYDVWVDWEDIPPSAKWLEEIREGVRSADAFIYVISPDSVVSEVCGRELDSATEQGKRIVPVVCRDPAGAAVPETAAALNWVFLRDADDFDAGVELLVAAVETDLEHVRMHTRLGQAASRWDASGRDSSQLLRGAELSAAEAWLVATGDTQPPPTQLQREYVHAGRQAATRRGRTVIAAVTVALVVAIVLAVVALIQRSTAIHEKNVAFARQLDANAQAALTTDPELSVLLAVKAAQVVPGTPSEDALRVALAESHVRQVFRLMQNAAGDALWSPGGNRLLVTNPGIWARIYRPGTSAPPVAIQGSPPSVARLSGWDGKGDRVVIGGGQPGVYDAATGASVGRVPGIAISAALSRDGTRVATTDAQGIGHVYDVATGRELAYFRPAYHAGVTCFAWAPDDSVIAQCDAKNLATSNAPASLDTWDPRTGKLLHSVHSDQLIGTVAFSPDSRWYVFTTTSQEKAPTASALNASIAAPGTLVYDSHTGAKVMTFPEGASAAAFSPDGHVLAYATVGDELGHVYNFGTRLSHLLTGQPGVMNSIAFDRASTYVVTAGEDGTARVYEASTGNFLEQLAGHTNQVRDASFGLNDQEIATTSEDGTTRLWASPDPRPALFLPGRDTAATIAFTVDSSRIIEAERSGQGRILAAGDLHPLAGFAAPSGYGFAGAEASMNGRVIGTLAGPTRGGLTQPVVAVTYDGRSGRMLARMAPTPGGGSLIGAIDLAGDRLVTAGADGSADEWDARTGQHLHTVSGTGYAASLAYSRDRSTLAIVHLPPITSHVTPETTFGPISIDLWDARTGRRLRTITGDTPDLTPQIPGTTAFARPTIVFRPDGRELAVAGVDQYVDLYATATGKHVGHLNPEGKFATSLAFSLNGKLLAVGTASSAYVWRLPIPAPLPEFRHADPSTYGFITGMSGVGVGFSADSQILLTVGDQAVEAWDPVAHMQLFKAFAIRGNLSPDGSKIVGTTINGVSVYPCELCGGLTQLLAVAKQHTTRGFTAAERARYLSQG